MDNCRRCGLFMVATVCRCVRFDAAIPWSGSVDDGDWREVYATDAEDAAERFAQRSDCEGDYTIIRNQEGEVWIRDAEGGVTHWFIEAEAVPTYHATQKPSPRQGTEHG